MLRRAEKSDREKVIEILSQALADDPGVSQTVKNDARRAERVRGLMAFAFDNFQPIGGVHISEDGKSAAVSYVPARQNRPFRDLFLHLKLLVQVVGISRIFTALKKKKMIESAHPADGKYQNVWLMGTVAQNKQDALQKIKTYLLDLAAADQLPLYVETGDGTEKTEYEAMGLVEHRRVEMAPGIYLWFMKKEVV